MVDTSELLLVIGAMVLLSVAIINVNRTNALNDIVLMESELEYTGIAIGQDIIDEARAKAFDENCVSSTPNNVPAGFTRSSKFGGMNDSENYANFDDFDDYHGMSRTENTRHGVYQVTANVNYVSETNPNSVSNNKTLYKRMNVIISSDFLPNQIQLSYVKTYQ